MYADMKAQTRLEREKWLNEKEDVQTSLVSKKQGDAQETFKIQ